jgi:hypothetical protein
MSNHVIKFNQRCKICKGTGLYQDFAEQEGAAIVCHSCKGKGWYHTIITYHDFEGKIKKQGVIRVFQYNPGIGIGKSQLKDIRFEDFGGMSYEDWSKGKPFPSGSEMRKYTCPSWWYQVVDYKKKPEWKKCCIFGSFSNCQHFKNKSQCWSEWDKEFGKRR